MFRKMLTVFGRDAKISFREFMSLMMIFVPVVLAIAVNLFAPGIEDTTINLALIDGENPKMAAYLDDFANVSLYKDYDAVEARVEKRDNVIGITGVGADATILVQGNESKSLVDYAKLLKTYFDYDRQIEDSTAELKEFGVTTPPVKMLWANVGILFVTVLAGMLITLNIVDEKMDNTVSAINVAPISRSAWIAGKALIGILTALVGCVAMVLIMGVAANVNFLQLLILVFIASLISIIIGFLQGLKSDDVMTAVGSTKMIFLPLAASVAGYEFLADKWQWTLYWSPFYWIYRGNTAVLNGSMTWPNMLLTCGIVLAITALVYAYVAPRIRKGLEH